ERPERVPGRPDAVRRREGLGIRPGGAAVRDGGDDRAEADGPVERAAVSMLGSPSDPAVTPEWAAYRAELLGLLGADDPAEVQASTPAAVRERVAAATSAGVLRTRPAPGEWSVIGLVGHLLDGEIYASARYRWILTED